MKHQAKGRKLGRKKDQRKALLRSLINHLAKYEKIETTEARAKEIRPKIEKLITKAKIKNLANTRFLTQYFQKSIAKKVVNEIAPKYVNRKGGYTRIIKVKSKRKDGSPMAIIEFI